jgi:hypothetical protein
VVWRPAASALLTDSPPPLKLTGLLLTTNGLEDRLRELMQELDYDNVNALHAARSEARGITSISLNPDRVMQTTRLILDAEKELADAAGSSTPIEDAVPAHTEEWQPIYEETVS